MWALPGLLLALVADTGSGGAAFGAALFLEAGGPGGAGNRGTGSLHLCLRVARTRVYTGHQGPRPGGGPPPPGCSGSPARAACAAHSCCPGLHPLGQEHARTSSPACSFLPGLAQRAACPGGHPPCPTASRTRLCTSRAHPAVSTTQAGPEDTCLLTCFLGQNRDLLGRVGCLHLPGAWNCVRLRTDAPNPSTEQMNGQRNE